MERREEKRGVKRGGEREEERGEGKKEMEGEKEDNYNYPCTNYRRNDVRGTPPHSTTGARPLLRRQDT